MGGRKRISRSSSSAAPKPSRSACAWSNNLRTCFIGVEVQLDLDAVGVVHEQLVERLAVRAALLEFDLVAPQVRHGLLQALRAERDVVDRARARARILREAPQVGLLVLARVLRAL